MKTKHIIITGVISILIAATFSVAAYTPGNDRERLLKNVRELLTKKTDSVINHLGEMRLRIDPLDGFSDEEKKEIKTKLDEYINFFEGKKSEINTAETREDFSILVRDMLDEWMDIVSYKESLRGIILTSKFDNIITKAEDLSDIIDTKISGLEANGTDTEKLEGLHSEFDAEINLIKGKTADARKEFESGNNREGHNLLKEAKKSLYDAYKILKDIVREFRELQGILQ